MLIISKVSIYTNLGFALEFSILYGCLGQSESTLKVAEEIKCLFCITGCS